jgi:hypothetical protein
MDNVVQLNVSPPTDPDEEFSLLVQNEIYTVRRKGDYPYRLALRGGVQLFVLPIDYPLDHVTGRERGRAEGRTEIRDGLKKLLHLENVS